MFSYVLGNLWRFRLLMIVSRLDQDDADVTGVSWGIQIVLEVVIGFWMHLWWIGWRLDFFVKSWLWLMFLSVDFVLPKGLVYSTLVMLDQSDLADSRHAAGPCHPWLLGNSGTFKFGLTSSRLAYWFLFLALTFLYSFGLAAELLTVDWFSCSFWNSALILFYCFA